MSMNLFSDAYKEENEKVDAIVSLVKLSGGKIDRRIYSDRIVLDLYIGSKRFAGIGFLTNTMEFFIKQGRDVEKASRHEYMNLLNKFYAKIAEEI